jgi:hypothetical protein
MRGGGEKGKGSGRMAAVIAAGTMKGSFAATDQ